MPIAKLVRKSLPDVLVEEGLIKEDQALEVHRHMRATGEGFVDVLVKLGLATDMDVAKHLVKQSGLPYIDAARYRIDRDVFKLLASDFLWQNLVVPLDKIGKTLLLAVAGVPNPEVYDKIERATGAQLFLYVTTQQQAREVLEKNAPQPKAAPAAAAKGAVPTPPGGAKPGTAAMPRPPAQPSAASLTAVRPGEKK
jgi:hypothetical protein